VYPVRTVARWLPLLVATAFAGSCGTVNLGDNISPPDLQLNEDYFFCVVQPQVITQYHCAVGASGEAGSCHTARSAMRLLASAESDAAPTCDAMNHVTGAVPDSYRQNLDAIRPEVQSTADDSSIYRRPTGLDSHPRVVFPVDPSPTSPAGIIEAWLAMGGV